MSQIDAIPPPPYQGPRTFTAAVTICLTQYFQFAGRAPRSEYWYFALFSFIVSLAADLVDAILFGIGSGILGTLVTLALFIPSLAVLVRRLHDIDRSGWWALLLLVPLVGFIVVLIWACTRGTEGENRFGPDPLGGSNGWGAATAAE